MNAARVRSEPTLLNSTTEATMRRQWSPTPGACMALTSANGSWTPRTTSTSARTGAHTTGSFTVERTCCARLSRPAAGAAGDGPAVGADPAATDSSTSVTGTSMTLNTSAPTGNRNRAQGRPVQVTEHHDARERDGRSADGKRGKRRQAKRPSQREPDDQEHHQKSAKHPAGDSGSQAQVAGQRAPLDSHSAREQQQRQRVQQHHPVQHRCLRRGEVVMPGGKKAKRQRHDQRQERPYYGIY